VGASGCPGLGNGYVPSRLERKLIYIEEARGTAGKEGQDWMAPPAVVNHNQNWRNCNISPSL